MYFKHSYDNENFFDSVSEEDYLIEKLTHLNCDNVLRCIDDADENAELFDDYIVKVDELRDFRLSRNVNFLLSGCVTAIEESLFKEHIQDPCIEFSITVELILTQINGRYIEHKEDTFNSNEIIDYINWTRDKDGEFYTDPYVWDAIVRVERAKVSNKMRFSIYDRDGRRCCKCGSRYNLEIDHIYPISKGGKTVYDNLQTLCHDCNVKKSNTVEQGAYNPRFDRKKHFCPRCNAVLVMKNGKNGRFYSCPNYPKCNYTKTI